jgi:hypothetical protein
MMRALRRRHLGEFEITDDLSVNYIGYATKEQT